MILMEAMTPMKDRTTTCPTHLHHLRRPDPMMAPLQDLATFRHPQDRTPVMEDQQPRTRRLITPRRLEQDLHDRIRMVPEGGRQMHM